MSVVPDENFPSDVGISFVQLHLKRHRMKSAMTKIKNSIGEDGLSNVVLDFFSLKNNPCSGPSNKTAPNSCRTKITPTKKSCTVCNELCSYSM